MGATGAVRIRAARHDDIPAVLALWKAADAVPSATDDGASIELLMQRDPGALLVAEVDARIVGTTVVGWDGWRASFYRLAVVPESRRLGVGRALVEEGERRLGALGAVRINALVVGEHAHAVEFWRALGYELDERIERFVKTTTTPGGTFLQ
jgi:ribosomal protein S18 acetylase RimI-like enzyme